MSGTDLSALVSARLCHDLISPIGAIGNGLELLGMSQGTPTGTGAAELDLIQDSLDTALAKLRFFRLAFGPADPQARLSLEEAAAMTGGVFQGRFTVAWRGEDRDMPRPDARLVFLAVLCLEKSLPMGGAVEVEVSPDGVRLTVDGRRTAAPEDLWAHVSDGTPLAELRSDAVQFALLRMALVDAGHDIAVDFSESAATITVRARSPMMV